MALSPRRCVRRCRRVCSDFRRCVRLQQMAGALERSSNKPVQHALAATVRPPDRQFQWSSTTRHIGRRWPRRCGRRCRREACSGEDIVVAEVAIAKVRAGEAAGTGGRSPVHGAMGFGPTAFAASCDTPAVGVARGFATRRWAQRPGGWSGALRRPVWPHHPSFVTRMNTTCLTRSMPPEAKNLAGGPRLPAPEVEAGSFPPTAAKDRSRASSAARSARASA